VSDTLSDFFETVYLPRRLLGGSPATLHHHRCYLRIFSRWLGRASLVTDLTEATVAGFLNAYSQGHSPFSVDSARNCILALWRFAVGKVPGLTSPEIAPPRLPQENPLAWTPEEVGRLLVAAWDFLPRCCASRTYCNVRPSLWWVGLVRLLYDSAFRRTAALELRWADVDFPGRLVTARAAHQKTARDEVREVSVETMAALWAIRAPAREKVFPFAADTVTYYHHFSTVLKAAGLPAGRKDKTQRLRRTHATWLAVAAGKTAAQESLGHESLRTTERSYLDQRYLRPVNAASKLPKPGI
jgi:integrase